MKMKEYRVEAMAWRNIIDRCERKTHPQYKNYGGRSPPITICDEWRNDFWQFLRDVGVRPDGDGTRKGEYSLDRIDNTRGYEPGNVRWATRIQQMRNRSDTCRFTYNGETKTSFQWAEMLGIPHSRFRTRMRSQLPIEKIMFAGNLHLDKK